MTRDEELQLDPECERCEAPIVDPRSAVVREAQTYCCANCARADAADIKAKGIEPHEARACSRCGAPIVDRMFAVEEGKHLFCCANCSAAGVQAEPLPGR